MSDNREGFTLIELLIVVVIIGILAAIAIPKFTHSKEKAFDATAMSDLRHLLTMSEAYFADNQEYPATIGDLADYNPSQGITVTKFDRETSNGTVVVHIHIEHDGSTHYFHIKYPEDQIERRDK